MDTFSRNQRSEIMRRVRSRGTQPEILVRSIVRRMGVRYRSCARNLPGKPDVTIVGQRKVILVHGCFWHGHNCKAGKAPQIKPPLLEAQASQKCTSRRTERPRAAIKRLESDGDMGMRNSWQRTTSRKAPAVSDATAVNRSQRNWYEFFAGGGMARLGLGPNWKCTFANDLCEKKASAYRAFFGPSPELKVDDVGDLTTKDLPGVPDLVWASFPLQDLSLAGNGEGLKGKRSGTFRPFWHLVKGMVRERGARHGWWCSKT